MSKLSGKNNINPEIWGPHFWRVFHLTAFGYPDSPNKVDKEAYENFYDNFAKILPCDACSKDSQAEMLKTDWDYVLTSRERLIKWTYKFHEDVNKKLNKESPLMTDFLNNYIIESKKKTCTNIVHNIIIILLIIFVGYLSITRCT